MRHRSCGRICVMCVVTRACRRQCRRERLLMHRRLIPLLLRVPIPRLVPAHTRRLSPLRILLRHPLRSRVLLLALLRPPCRHSTTVLLARITAGAIAKARLTPRARRPLPFGGGSRLSYQRLPQRRVSAPRAGSAQLLPFATTTSTHSASLDSAKHAHRPLSIAAW